MIRCLFVCLFWGSLLFLAVASAVGFSCSFLGTPSFVMTRTPPTLLGLRGPAIALLFRRQPPRSGSFVPVAIWPLLCLHTIMLFWTPHPCSPSFSFWLSVCTRVCVCVSHSSVTHIRTPPRSSPLQVCRVSCLAQWEDWGLTPARHACG